MANNLGRNVNVNCTFKGMEPTDAVVNYVVEKVGKAVEKFSRKPVNVRVVVKVEKNRHIAEANFRMDGNEFCCKEESHDLYSSIDELSDAVQQQLRKHKEMVRDRKHRRG
ncbi:MAG: ribosome-associated translation inhibitor RaiA [Candidatus Dadabacteria bacterium]|nr:MAG: ribosome-associated translation inhibitor RaiA [Candidatus Dadabacteria bacterium]